MKKFKSMFGFLVLLIAICMFPVCANAASPEAKIGNKNYKTLQEAVNAVKNGQTIKVLRNISVKRKGTMTPDFDGGIKSTKNVKCTIDLCKHTIKIEGKDFFYGMFLCKKGNVTIKNGTFKGVVKIEKNAVVTLQQLKMIKTGYVSVDNYGRVYLKKVSASNLRINGWKKSKTYLNNCTLTSKNHLFYGTGGDLSITGGKYTGKAESKGGSSIPLIWITYGKLNISSGKFSSENSYVLHTESTAVTIKSGTFSSGDNATAFFGKDFDDTSGKLARVIISGGTFTSKQKESGGSFRNTVAIAGVDAKITGGKFLSYSDRPGSETIDFSSGKLRITGGYFYSKSGPAVNIWLSAGDSSFTQTGGSFKTDNKDSEAIRDYRNR